MGFNYFRSSENFNPDSERESISYKSQTAILKQTHFIIEPEYGFLENCSLRIRTGFLTNSLNSEVDGRELISGRGYGDLVAAVKVSVFEEYPTLAVESLLKVPTYAQIPPNNNTLVEGDGNLDIGLLAHLGHLSGEFFAAATPGILIRTGGYSQALVLKLAVGRRLEPIYGVLFSDFILSLGEDRHLDSSLTSHDALGSGNSFALLSGSPTGWSMGLKLGAKFTKNYGVEGSLSHALWGKRYPNNFQLGLYLTANFDFFEPEQEKIKYKEVPFDQPQKNTDQPVSP